MINATWKITGFVLNTSPLFDQNAPELGNMQYY